MSKAVREAELRGEIAAIENRRKSENREFTKEEEERLEVLLTEREAIRNDRNRRLSAVMAEPAGLANIRASNPSDPVLNPDGTKYSLMRAINLLADRRAVDGYEGEISQEISRRAGNLKPGGFFMPLGLPMLRNAGPVERRDLTTTAGAGAVQTTFLGNRFIDALRARTVLASLGATVLEDLVGDIQIPKQTGTGAAYWVTEGNAVTESAQAIGQVSMSPSTVGAFTDITRKLMKQTSLDVEQLVRDDLTRVIGIELDRVGLNGSGTGAEPEGILQNGSIATVAIGTNGGDPTWAKVVELESEVRTANADRGSMAYLTSNYGRGKLKTVTKGDAGYPIFLWDMNNTINGYAAASTSLVPSDLTKGTGENLTALIFGDFSTVFMGMWGAVDILVDHSTFSTTGSVRVTALLDTDIQFRNVESLAMCVDMAR